jgi:hypothetical protein
MGSPLHIKLFDGHTLQFAVPYQAKSPAFLAMDIPLGDVTKEMPTALAIGYGHITCKNSVAGVQFKLNKYKYRGYSK